MTFPLSIVIYDAGLGGIPTTNNPRVLSGWVEDYGDSTVTNFGHESLRITGTVRSREDAAYWTQCLIFPVEVYTPSGRLHFAGFLNGVSIPALDVDMSLTNMANVVIVRWGDPNGQQGTVTVTNAASIARYGRKERVLNESISLEADATNRATMILTQIAEPPNKETVTIERGDGPFTVTLVISGWAEALKWLTMSSATETTQASTTQVSNILIAYNAINAFLDLAGASITATGHAATQFCPPDTTYYDRIDKLLSYGDTSQRRIAWGFYSRAITIAVAATSAPDTITYSYSKRAGELRDAYGNVIPAYDWVPDVMVQNVDVIGPAPASGAIASLTRKYIRRATLKIGKDGIPSGTLEPDDVDSLAEWVANPVSKNTGITQRHQIAETRIRDAIGSRTIRTDNNNLWDSDIGVLKPGAGGTGKINTGTIDTGGGDIVFDPGGGTGLTGGGSSPNLAKWSGPSALTNAVSGTDYAPAHAHPYASTSHDHPHTDITDWNEAVDDRVGALLVAGTNISLTYNDAGDTLTVASTAGGTIDGSGAATRVAFFSDADTLTTDADFTFASDYLSAPHLFISGAAGDITIRERDGSGDWIMYATASLFRFFNGSDIVTIDTAGKIVSDSTAIELGGNTLTLNNDLTISGAGSSLTLSHAGAYTLTIPATGTAALGTGTSGYAAFWSGTNTLSANANLRWDNSNLWLGIGGAPSYTLHVFDSAPTIMAEATGAGQAQVSLKNSSNTYSMAVSGSSWKLHDNDAGSDRITVLSSGHTTIAQGLSLGTASGATVGALRASSDVSLAGGLYVGSASTVAGDGDIICTGTLKTAGGVEWNFGSFVGTVNAIVGYVIVEVSGTTRHLAVVS